MIQNNGQNNGQNNNNNNQVGFFRPFGSNLGREISASLDKAMAVIGQNKSILCGMHRRKKVSLDKTAIQYERALSRVVGTGDANFPTERTTNYTIVGQTVAVKEYRYKCSECGDSNIWIPEFKTETDVIETFRSVLAMMDMLAKTELFYRSGMADNNPSQVPTGAALIGHYLTEDGDMARFSSAQFRLYVGDYLDKYVKLSDANKAPAGGIPSVSSDVITGMITSAPNLSVPAYASVSGNLTGGLPKDQFMREMVQPTQPANMVASVGTVDIAK